MKLTHIFLFGLFFCAKINAQTHNEFYQSLVDEVNYTNLQENLTDFVNFGEKTLGSAAASSTLNWMVDLYESWGYTDIEQHEVNAYGQTGYNLIVTKKGSVYPDTYIIIDGHYDTLNGPGANDNGSGTAIILEMARVLKDIPTEYSIKFIHFTAEEWGLIGSIQYVENVVIPENLDIRLVFNIDQVGGVAGETNDTITCERDESSPHHNNSESSYFTNQLMTCIELYSDLNTNLSYAYGSDYVPFQEAGYVITGLYEYNESPYPHTSQDKLENVDFDFIYQVAKGTMGALSHFAIAYEGLATKELNMDSVKAFPNPVDKTLSVHTLVSGEKKVQINDLLGKRVYSSVFSEDEFEINTSQIPNGIYILNVSNGKSVSSQKIIVQHK